MNWSWRRGSRPAGRILERPPRLRRTRSGERRKHRDRPARRRFRRPAAHPRPQPDQYAPDGKAPAAHRCQRHRPRPGRRARTTARSRREARRHRPDRHRKPARPGRPRGQRVPPPAHPAQATVTTVSSVSPPTRTGSASTPPAAGPDVLAHPTATTTTPADPPPDQSTGPPSPGRRKNRGGRGRGMGAVPHELLHRTFRPRSPSISTNGSGAPSPGAVIALSA